ncbi:hypothetical protein [Vibrio kanaloae]|uniref:hypothetical protein n=1 Tax=Vibrio kanaloae TaxID=170673 RepID=UPI001483BC3B|nr:hypothetical protein [Vibrio kanaloae]
MSSLIRSDLLRPLSRSPMPKPRYKTINWKQYNQSLIRVLLSDINAPGSFFTWH